MAKKDLDYQCHIADLKTYMVQRGYDEEEVQFQLNKASGMKCRTKGVHLQGFTWLYTTVKSCKLCCKIDVNELKSDKL